MVRKRIILNDLIETFKVMENAIKSDLRVVVSEREQREYRDDILQLSATDISLLTYYYMNSNDLVKKQFLNLLSTVYKEEEIKRFFEAFHTLYFFSKSHLSSTLSYGASKRVVLDFINRLKDQSLHDKKTGSKREKELTDQLFVVRKIISYLKAPSGSIEIRNIDKLTAMLELLNVKEEIINDTLYIVIQNNNKFYRGQINLMKKKIEE